MDWIVEQLKKERWSPYAAGVLLGLINVAALLLISKPLGASAAFAKLSSYIATLLSPSAQKSMYFKYVMPPGINFTVVVVVGILIGSFISAKMSGDFRWRMITDQQWIDVFGPSLAKRWILAFVGGVILEYSARLAGGCTSGLAISGTMQLAPSGLIFIFGLFASGIVTTFLIYGKKYY